MISKMCSSHFCFVCFNFLHRTATLYIFPSLLPYFLGDGKKATGISKSPFEGSTPEPSRPSLVPEEEEGAEDTVPKLPPIVQRLRLRLMSQSLQGAGSEPPAKQIEKTDAPARARTDRDGPTGGKNSVVSKLIKSSKNAYFMSSTPSKSQTSGLTLPPAQPPSERSYKPTLSIHSDPSVTDGAQTTQRGIPPGTWKSLTARSATSASSSTEEAGGEDEEKKTTARRAAGRKKRRPRVSSALLLSKAKSSEGSIPLPLISHEQDRRPFFYHQGQREDALVDSALELVAKYRGGDSSRERAIQSLTTANTFRDKPWLGQVRVALSLTSNSLKRNVRRLQVRKKKLIS